MFIQRLRELLKFSPDLSYYTGIFQEDLQTQRFLHRALFVVKKNNIEIPSDGFPGS